MTAGDSVLNAIIMHDLIDKVEIEQEEINRMHEMVEHQRKILENVWFTILDVDKVIAKQSEKNKDNQADPFLKILRTVRDEFLKAVEQPNYFKS